VSGSFVLENSYARLSGTTSEDQGDRSAFAVDNVVSGAAITRGTGLSLLDRQRHGEGSCVKQVRECSGVLHLGCLGRD
jgi:hypothetical protein